MREGRSAGYWQDCTSISKNDEGIVSEILGHQRSQRLSAGALFPLHASLLIAVKGSAVFTSGKKVDNLEMLQRRANGWLKDLKGTSFKTEPEGSRKLSLEKIRICGYLTLNIFHY